MDSDETDFADVSSNEEYDSKDQQPSIYAQAHEISQFLKEHYATHQHDESFQKLQLFFSIFTTQLKMNYELRNRLRNAAGSEPLDIKKYRFISSSVSEFIESYSKLAGKEFNNLQEVILHLKRMFGPLAELSNEQKSVQKYGKSIEHLAHHIQSIQQSTDSMFSKIDQQKEELQAGCNDIAARVSRLTSEIEELEKANPALEELVQEKESLRNDLLQQIDERRMQIEASRNRHQVLHDERHEVIEKLKVKIAKLRVSKQQLVANEVPLSRAFEEVQSELLAAEQITKDEMESIKRRVEEINSTFAQRNEQMNIQKEKKQQLEYEIQHLSSSINLEETRHTKLQSDIEHYQSCIEEQEVSQEEEDPGYYLSEVNSAIDERLAEIEDLRKEINRISSCLRVTRAECQKLQSEKKSVSSRLKETKVEVSEKMELFESSRKQMEAYRATMAAFEKLKNGIGITDDLPCSEIGKQSIELVNGAFCVDEDAERPVKISMNSVSSDLSFLSQQLDSLQSQLLA